MAFRGLVSLIRWIGESTLFPFLSFLYARFSFLPSFLLPSTLVRHVPIIHTRYGATPIKSNPYASPRSVLMLIDTDTDADADIFHSFHPLTSHRPGANPNRIVQQIRTKLRMPAALVHVPIGVEDEFRGVVDLVHWKSIYYEGPKG
jgi:hypothetical protein